MRGYSLQRLRADRNLFGPLLETFVFAELLKIALWSDQHVSIYYYRSGKRTKGQRQSSSFR